MLETCLRQVDGKIERNTAGRQTTVRVTITIDI